jgi:hypothetical protein
MVPSLYCAHFAKARKGEHHIYILGNDICTHDIASPNELIEAICPYYREFFPDCYFSVPIP